MRLRREYAFWYVLAGLALLYLIGVIVRGGVGSALAWAAQFVLGMAGVVLAITVHECAHAWSANYLGDPTARLAGRVTLNPLAHLDPLGSLMIVMTTLTGVGIGWGKPTPVRPYRLKYGARLGNGLVALSGPLSNIAVAVVLGLALRITPCWPWASLFSRYWPCVVLRTIVLTNLYIAVFNLLPIPPLDGHSVLLALLSLVRSNWAWRVSEFLVRLEAQGPFLLLGLIILTQFLGFPLLSWAVGRPASAMYRIIVD